MRGRVGRAADDPTQWVLTTEWTGVGAYRRSLSSYDVKVDAAPLLSLGARPSAFEVLHAGDVAAPAVVTPAAAPTTPTRSGSARRPVRRPATSDAPSGVSG